MQWEFNGFTEIYSGEFTDKQKRLKQRKAEH